MVSAEVGDILELEPTYVFSQTGGVFYKWVRVKRSYKTHMLISPIAGYRLAFILNVNNDPDYMWKIANKEIVEILYGR